MKIAQLASVLTVGIALSVLVGCQGCSSLDKQTPKADILFDRAQGQLHIQSAKDVILKDVKVELEGTNNVTITIGSYEARNNTELIAAALQANQSANDNQAKMAGAITKQALDSLKSVVPVPGLK